MNYEITKVKMGISLALFGVLFGLMIGVLLNNYEDSIKNFINEGIALHPFVHSDPAASEQKIWQYVQQSYFYATSIATISIALIVLTMTTALRTRFKSLTAALIGFMNFYPLSWLSMFWLSPDIGIQAAHEHLLTQLTFYSALIGGIAGIALLILHIYFNLFHEKTEYQDNYRRQIVEYKY